MKNKIFESTQGSTQGTVLEHTGDGSLIDIRAHRVKTGEGQSGDGSLIDGWILL